MVKIKEYAERPRMKDKVRDSVCPMGVEYGA